MELQKPFQTGRPQEKTATDAEKRAHGPAIDVGKPDGAAAPSI